MLVFIVRVYTYDDRSSDQFRSATVAFAYCKNNQGREQRTRWKKPNGTFSNGATVNLSGSRVF
jgi:hypothetical protein